MCVGSVRSRVFGADAVPVLRARGGGRHGSEVRAQSPGSVTPERDGDRREGRLGPALRESARLPV